MRPALRSLFSSTMADRQASIIASSLGLMMAASSPASIAMAKKADEISGRHGRPNEMLLTPSTVFSPQPFLTRRIAVNVSRRPFLFGADGEGQAVDYDIFRRDAGGFSCHDNLFGDCRPPLPVGGYPALIQGEPDDRRAVFSCSAAESFRGFSPSPVHRIHQHLAVGGLEPSLQRCRIGGIEHERSIHRAARRKIPPAPWRPARRSGRPHVYIEQMSLRPQLLHRLPPDIGNLPLSQFGGKELSCRWG